MHDPELWAKAAKDARNDLAHVGTAENDLEHMHAVAEVTAGVVILNLLHELGVPQDRLQKAVEENPVLSYAGRLAREVLCNDHSMVMQIAALNVTVVDAEQEPVPMEVDAVGKTRIHRLNFHPTERAELLRPRQIEDGVARHASSLT